MKLPWDKSGVTLVCTFTLGVIPVFIDTPKDKGWETIEPSVFVTLGLELSPTIFFIAAALTSLLLNPRSWSLIADFIFLYAVRLNLEDFLPSFTTFLFSLRSFFADPPSLNLLTR